MKKWSLLIILFFILFPLKAKANRIENFYVNAVVEKNGDLTIEEYFYLTGKSNGFERIINYYNEDASIFDPSNKVFGGSNLHNGSGIELQEIRALNIDPYFNFKNISGTIFRKVTKAKSGDYGVYTTKKTDYGEKFKIFLPSTKSQAFYLKYTLKNIAILHEDIAEIGWNVIGNELNESVANLKVQITFPNNQDLKVWAHGPKNGTITKISNQILEATITNLPSNTGIDIRAAFDKEVISFSNKKSNVPALSKIIAYEEEQALTANQKRKQEILNNLNYCKKYPTRACYKELLNNQNYINDEDFLKSFQKELEELKKIVTQNEEDKAQKYALEAEQELTYKTYLKALESIDILENESLKNELNEKLNIIKENIIQKEKRNEYNNIIISLVIIMTSYIIAISMHKNKHKPEFNHKYLRDFPSNYTPTTVSYLMKKDITNDAIAAEILNLINRKIILYEDKSTKWQKDYLLKRNDEGLTLTEKEKRILHFLFYYDQKISLKELKKSAHKTNSAFFTRFTNLEKLALIEAEKEELFEKDKISTNNSKSYFYYILITWIIFTIIIILGQSYVAFIFLVILMVASIINFSAICRILKKIENYKLISTCIIFLLINVSLISLEKIIKINHFYHNSIIFNIITIVLAIIAIIKIQKMQKRTKKGVEEYAKWGAFKNFLKDFGNMNEKELPEIELWEKYLVYAVVLGCAKKLEKVMKMKLQKMNVDKIDFESLYATYQINHMVNKTINSVITTTRNKKMTHYSSRNSSSSSSSGSFSSGSGSGGGFSSGGGSFGGGGGGSRF